jgi:hypothetical protein
MRLPDDDAVAFAEAERLNRLLVPPETVKAGTISALIDAYLGSTAYEELGTETRSDYRRHLAKLRIADVNGRKLGDFSPEALRPAHADALYEIWRRRHGDTVGGYVCRVARRLWHWGHRRGLTPSVNPWAKMELKTPPPRRQRWAPAQVEALVTTADSFHRRSVALAVLLAYWLGHRRGAVLSLTWEEIAAGHKETRKTGAIVPLDPWIYPDLAVRLEEIPAERRTGPIVLNEATGRPWRMDTFSKLVRELMRAAGLPKDIQFRDLRATAMTELNDAGASIMETRAHSGHQTLQMAARYNRPTVTQFQLAAAKRLKARNKR